MALTFYVPSSVEELTFNDDFTGTNGDPWNSVKWDIINGSPEIQSNKGRQEIPGGGGGAQIVRADHNLILPAQEAFDIQVDWDLVSNAHSGDYWIVNLSIFAQSGTSESPYDDFYFQLTRLYSSGAHRLRVTRNDGDPVQWGYQETADSSTSGKFRFTRVLSGGDPALNSHWGIHGYWDVGSGWHEHWDTMWGTKAAFEVQLRAQNGNGNGEVVVDWDNLIKVV